MEIYQFVESKKAAANSGKTFDEPAQFVSAYIELQKISNGATVTHLPILFDATCNGLQHLGLLSRSVLASRLTNAIGNPSNDRFDVYRHMASAAEENL